MAFYQAVFGWQFRNSSMSGLPYVVAKVHQTPVCGIHPMVPEEWHDDVGPHWTVYFAVPDCDVATDRAVALGGSVVRPPTTLPVGRYAVLADAQGGWFAVLAGQR